MKIKELASLLYDLVLDTEEIPISRYQNKTENLIETELKLFFIAQIQSKINDYATQLEHYNRYGLTEEEYEIRKSELENLLKELE